VGFQRRHKDLCKSSGILNKDLCKSSGILNMSAGRPAIKPTPAFGKKLAQFRKRRGWTQPELAELVGVAVKTITYYEREATNPTAKTIERLAEVFGITPAELMKDVKQPSKAKTGPPSRLENIFEKVSSLPRSKQKVVADMLEGFLEKTTGA
jgi:transcriptional regulator with XRE-family HTH domain